jgi:hypothetical protein
MTFDPAGATAEAFSYKRRKANIPQIEAAQVGQTSTGGIRDTDKRVEFMRGWCCASIIIRLSKVRFGGCEIRCLQHDVLNDAGEAV